MTAPHDRVDRGGVRRGGGSGIEVWNINNAVRLPRGFLGIWTTGRWWLLPEASNRRRQGQCSTINWMMGVLRDQQSPEANINYVLSLKRWEIYTDRQTQRERDSFKFCCALFSYLPLLSRWQLLKPMTLFQTDTTRWENRIRRDVTRLRHQHILEAEADYIT